MENRIFSKLIWVAFLSVAFTLSIFAVVPNTITYQGYLTDSSGLPVDATESITFSIYKLDVGGVPLWSETESVTVTNGTFTNELGDTTPIPAGFFGGAEYYLGITIGTDAEMSPRKPLTTVPHAFKAAEADNANTVDGQHAAEIIEAASDEVRTPISSLPLNITTSGSYYFTQNLTHTLTTTNNAITVNANNVTIDMMGFTLTGPGKNTEANHGIAITNQSNVTILNGTVTEFGNHGIVETSTSGDSHRVIDVRVLSNGGNGIYLIGNNNQVRGCTAKSNGEATTDYGIYGGDGALLINNTASENAGRGIHGNVGATVTNNTAFKNSSIGIYGNSGATMTNNTAYNNTQGGIQGVGSNLIEGNTVHLNNSIGIRVGSVSRVVGNVADKNGLANIYVESSGNVIERNHVSNVTTFFGYGIQFISSENLFRDNTATQNGNGTPYGGNLPPVARNINNIIW